MNNYLTNLYFRLFQVQADRRRIMENRDFSCDADAHRNDERIVGCDNICKLLNELISDYMQVIKQSED